MSNISAGVQYFDPLLTKMVVGAVGTVVLRARKRRDLVNVDSNFVVTGHSIVQSSGRIRVA